MYEDSKMNDKRRRLEGREEIWRNFCNLFHKMGRVELSKHSDNHNMISPLILANHILKVMGDDFNDFMKNKDSNNK